MGVNSILTCFISEDSGLRVRRAKEALRMGSTVSLRIPIQLRVCKHQAPSYTFVPIIREADAVTGGKKREPPLLGEVRAGSSFSYVEEKFHKMC